MIRKIEWMNDPILGNLSLNFEKPGGGIYNTVIFIGENGSGKTTILTKLNKFLSGQNVQSIKLVEYDYDNTTYKMSHESIHYSSSSRSAEGLYLLNLSDGNEKYLGSFSPVQGVKVKINDDIRTWGTVFSKARAGFNANQITSIQTNTLDKGKFDNDESDDFSYLKQLLVDLNAQDNSEGMMEWKNNKNAKYEDFNKKSKMYRFTTAFNSFFKGKLAYSQIKLTNGDYKILFSKCGKDIPIDDLSTGEKQIVFRGTYLLRNIDNLSKGLVFIDEPELSMHPIWQEKVLEFYRGLFTIENSQTAQLFFASHSQYVVKSAINDKNNVLIYIMQSSPNGVIAKRMDANLKLPSITSCEINRKAFETELVDYHIALYSTLQTIKRKSRIKDMDNEILADSHFNSSIHSKHDIFVDGRRTITYETLPTYIRNAIDHPDSGRTYTPTELLLSIQLMESMI